MIGSLSLVKILRATLSLLLVFWIAGLACIFGCERLAMSGNDVPHSAAAQSTSTVVAGSSCHKPVDHSCCSKRRLSAKHSKAVGSWLALPSAPAVELNGGLMRECPMALNAKALGTNSRTDESATAIALEPIDLPLFNTVKPLVTPAPSFLSNRCQTYLRCCVFLI
jgi:hypothetical protein